MTGIFFSRAIHTKVQGISIKNITGTIETNLVPDTCKDESLEARIVPTPCRGNGMASDDGNPGLFIANIQSRHRQVRVLDVSHSGEKGCRMVWTEYLHLNCVSFKFSIVFGQYLQQWRQREKPPFSSFLIDTSALKQICQQVLDSHGTVSLLGTSILNETSVCSRETRDEGLDKHSISLRTEL